MSVCAQTGVKGTLVDARSGRPVADANILLSDQALLAITDHDTIAGVDEAMAAGRALGLQVIRGVELSAREHHNFHILGYGFRDGDTELSRLCEKFRAGRDERKYKIVDFLQEKGMDIDLAEVEALAGGEVIARPHFAQVMVRHGYVSTNREAFDCYLDTEEFRQKVKRYKIRILIFCHFYGVLRPGAYRLVLDTPAKAA